MPTCTCGRGEVFHPPFHDESCEMYEPPKAKPKVVLSDDDPQATNIVIRGLQAVYGHWHDKYGFRWDDAVAEAMNRTLCEAVGLDPDQPMAAQRR